MGNLNSCFNSSKTTVNLVRLDGEVQRYNRSIKVAEIMLNNPRHFVCDLKSLKAGQSIAGLTADRQLKRGKFYLLLPLCKLNTPCSDSDISKATLKRYKWRSSKSKVTPVGDKLFGRSQKKEESRLERKEPFEASIKKDKTFPRQERKVQFHEVPKLWREGDKNAEEFELIIRQRKRRWKPSLATIEECPPVGNTWKCILLRKRASI